MFFNFNSIVLYYVYVAICRNVLIPFPMTHNIAQKPLTSYNYENSKSPEGSFYNGCADNNKITAHVITKTSGEIAISLLGMLTSVLGQFNKQVSVVLN